MASRRGSLQLSPVPSLAGSSVAQAASRLNPKAALSPEYMEAMQTMNETNMANACELLLSERDYEQPKADGNGSESGEKSDLDKLLEFYAKCQRGMKAIEKQVASAPTSGMPQAPSLGSRGGAGGPPGSRGGPPPPKLKQKSGAATTSKQGVIPMRRTTHMNHRTGVAQKRNGMERDLSHTSLASAGGGSGSSGGGGASMTPSSASGNKRGLERQPSHSSLGGDDSSVSSHASNSAKKARLSPPTTGKDVKTPPQNALSFLAKLNKDPKDRSRMKQSPKPNRRGSA